MTFEEIEAFLQQKTLTRYERTRFDRFLKSINFSFNVPSIHVTGSNGKGSTCTFLSYIYKNHDLKVGLYISPFFYHPVEMIQINNEEISREEFTSIFSKFESEFLKFDLSAFEIETFIALHYFKNSGCDLCIIETGMGGLIDATNCFTPILSIITSICLEHTSYLGTTYSEIASNKAGIIKEKVPVLIGKLEETAESTIRDIAASLEAPLHIVDSYYYAKYEFQKGFTFDYRPYTDLFIPVNLSSQITDATLAIEATKILDKTFIKIDDEKLRKGLNEFKLICRGEFFNNVFVDGAHNIEAAEELLKNYKNFAGNKPIHILFASFKDKNIAAILPTLARDAATLNLTTFDHPRARDEFDYFLYETDYPFIQDWKEGLNNLISQYPEDVILVTGSLAFVSLVRKYLNEK